MREYKKLWLLLAAVLAITFGILGWSGVEVYKQVPPIPSKVVTTSGQVLMTEETILDGQTAWQSTGGRKVGSIWGHGAIRLLTGLPTGCTENCSPGWTWQQ